MLRAKQRGLHFALVVMGRRGGQESITWYRVSVQFCPCSQLALKQRWKLVMPLNSIYLRARRLLFFGIRWDMAKVSVTMCPGQGIQKSYPLHNKVTETVMGKAMSEGFRVSWTNVTLITLHVILASQFNSFNWQKNNAGKKNRKKKYFSAILLG